MDTLLEPVKTKPVPTRFQVAEDVFLHDVVRLDPAESEMLETLHERFEKIVEKRARQECVATFIRCIKMTTSNKLNPIPVRLDGRENALVTAVAKATGLTKSEILRRACRFALPRFLSGKINIARVVAEEVA